MLVALLLPKVLDRMPERPVMLLGGVMLALSLYLGWLGPSFTGLAGLWLLLGAGASLVMTPSGRLLKRSCQPVDRPALFAAQFSLSHSCWLVTYPLAGWLGVNLGLTGTFALLGTVALAATGLAALIWHAHDPMALEHEHAAQSHTHLHYHDEHHQHEHEGWEGPEPHRHSHHHSPGSHGHVFVIDDHHSHWPS